ncbi:MAG TPA: hypothetical protein VGD26_03335 [Chitinophagaceae bacterium]
MKHVRIHLNQNILIPSPTEVKVGMEVLRAYNPNLRMIPYQFGTFDENQGVVTEIGELPNPAGKMVKVAIITWPGGYTTEDYLENLLPVVDFNDWRVQNGTSELPVPKYRVDQVMFIRPNPMHRTGPDYPAIGSVFETDVKITDVKISRFGSVLRYVTYIPGVGYRSFIEEELCTPTERERIVHADLKEYFFTVDALPFFRRGERVKALDGFLYNLDESVIVKINDKLKEYLSWSIKPE